MACCIFPSKIRWLITKIISTVTVVSASLPLWTFSFFAMSTIQPAPTSSSGTTNAPRPNSPNTALARPCPSRPTPPISTAAKQNTPITISP